MPELDYQPLERLPNRPAIRLVVLHRGDRDDPIKITLKHSAFADKPKYEALSYAWGGPNNTKAVDINGTSVPVRRNLDRALRHFRKKDEERVLWIDAICINQANDAEKSWQVKLMADIYRRAQRVLVWLGIYEDPELPKPKTTSRRISLNIRKREDKGRDSKAQEIKVKEDKGRQTLEYQTLCQKPYWKRVWIVQEVGAAVDLEIHWDVKSKGVKKLTSKSESWDEFFNKVQIEKALSEQAGSNPAIDLAQQREGRHGDAFLLANLIEACADSLCELPQDKIYGFVGIAHDCEDGSFPVDYSKSLWKLYEDVVRFQYASANAGRGNLDAAKSLVHFSQLVLRILKDVKAPPDSWMGSMHSGICTACIGFGHVEDGSCLFKITSVYGGNVSIIGPSYDEITGNPSVRKAWNLALKDCDADVVGLREANDLFISRILALEDSELRKAVTNIHSFGWRYLYDSISICRICHPLSVSVEAGIAQGSWRLFATKEGTIGLISSYVRKGDMLCHFWKSDVVAVVRAEDNETWRIVGKAMIAKQSHLSEGGALNFESVDEGMLGRLYLDVVALFHLTG
jgi:hypothetical protein